MLTLHSSEATDTQPCMFCDFPTIYTVFPTKPFLFHYDISVWIYKLGPEGKDPFGNSQYEYAIVSNWVKYPVTVLVRDPDTFKAKYQKEVCLISYLFFIASQIL